MTSASFRGWLIGLFAFVSVFSASRAYADQPTIERNREADVMSLLAPYRPGSEVANGWKLWDIAIQATQIELGLRGPDEDGADITLILVHPTQADKTSTRTPSFALRATDIAQPGALVARDALIDAIRQNDDGRFWRITRPISTTAGQNVPRFQPKRLLFDGLVLTIAGGLLIIALAVHLLKTAPRFVRIALPLVVLLGAGLRAWLSPEVFLGAWPWSRIPPNVGVIWTSPLFGALVEYLNKTVYFTDFVLSVNFLYACAMPLVLFTHASQLLRDTRAGLAAAAIVALSPHHIRFSHCEDAFVPSLVITSLAFSLIHTFMRDPSRPFRWFALVALPFALWAGYLLRPLNIMFVVVYLAAVVLLHPEQSPPRRRLLVGLVVGGVWFAAFIRFLELNHAQVADAATNAGWLLGVLPTLVQPSTNLLIHPLATPPALLILAGLGSVWLKRRGEGRLAIFLLFWLASFFVAHGYVVTAPMQPRYHLHLLVPFTLLASTGVVELYQRNRRAFVVVAATIALAPGIGLSWIRDISYPDVMEYVFVREARDLVPDGCTVVEYVGDHSELHLESRFERIGQRLVGGEYSNRFSATLARSSDSDGSRAVAPIIQDPLAKSAHACVYVYEGLCCWGQKDLREAYAATCSAMVDAAPLETVSELRAPYRPYDDTVTRGVTPGTTHVRFALSRALSADPVAGRRTVN